MLAGVLVMLDKNSLGSHHYLQLDGSRMRLNTYIQMNSICYFFNLKPLFFCILSE